MSEVDSTVVGMPAHTDPGNPDAQHGSINQPLSDHPVAHSEDYGQAVQVDTLDVTADDPTVAGALQRAVAGKSGYEDEDAPLDREQWNRGHWKAAAKKYGLTVGGNMDEVKTRVEEYEASVDEAKAMNAGDWQGEIENAEDAGSLAELRSLYDASGAEFPTVVSAFDAKDAEFKGGGN